MASFFPSEPECRSPGVTEDSRNQCRLPPAPQRLVKLRRAKQHVLEAFANFLRIERLLAHGL